MKKRLSFSAFLLFTSIHAQDTSITQRISVWLQREMNIIKKLPGAAQRCVEAKMHCSPEDKEIIKDGSKRIAGVIAVLGGLAIAAVAYHKNRKVQLIGLGSEDQIEVKGLFHDAIWQEKIEDVKSLFALYAIPSAVLNKWFVKAIQGTTPDIIEIMLQNGANPSYVEISDTTGAPMTMLAAAIYRSYGNTREIDHTKQILQLLLKYGASINAINNPGGHTALMIAVDINVPDIVQMLLDAGADKAIQNTEGATAYDIAVKKGFAQSELLKR